MRYVTLLWFRVGINSLSWGLSLQHSHHFSCYLQWSTLLAFLVGGMDRVNGKCVRLFRNIFILLQSVHIIYKFKWPDLEWDYDATLIEVNFSHFSFAEQGNPKPYFTSPKEPQYTFTKQADIVL